MTGMLASVNTLTEARQVLDAGADIIDLKEPSRGALGALDMEQVRMIRQQIGYPCQVSATIGDLPMKPDSVLNAVTGMAKTGVDYIKIGFFPGGDWTGTINALSAPAKAGSKLVAVFFADTGVDTDWIRPLSNAGFRGAMIDTLDKTKGSLTTICPEAAIENFVDTAKNHGLLCGLAGSLRNEDIPSLLKYEPDYLGFRGALCIQNQRTKGLDEIAVRTIRKSIHDGAPIR